MWAPSENQGGGGAFGGPWGVPDIKFTVDPRFHKVYVILNSTYIITAKDLAGNSLYVIERPFENVRINQEDKKKMLPFTDKEPFSWILEAYPDELVAVKELAVLPKGFLAAHSIIGPQRTTIDVFDPEGRFVYELRLPDTVGSEISGFYDFGFSTIEDRDDMMVYVEYRVKNLPEIFTNN